jgi:lipid A 3-O-deacylase
MLKFFPASKVLITFVLQMRRWILYTSLIFLFTTCSEHHPGDKSPEKKAKPGAITGIHGPAGSILNPPGVTNETVGRSIFSGNPKRKKPGQRPPPALSQVQQEARVRAADSLFISKILYLKAHNLDIDLAEPRSREFLASPVITGYESMVTISRDRILQVNFDNDILDNTDRFYTNGVRFDFISPALRQFPLNFLMVPYWGNGMNYYGVSLVQNMYTPSTTKVGGIPYGDRPYAAYLLLGGFRITNDQRKKFRQTSEFDIGIVGPLSFGDFVQKSFHNSVPTNNEPLGWEYQVSNDFAINYTLTYEKGLLAGRNIELNATGSGAVGTLYTNINGGLLFRTGILNPYFANLGIARAARNKEEGLRNVQFIFFMKANGKFVGYDATLEGGVFNNTSVYTIDPVAMSRFVFTGSAGLTFTLGGVSYTLEQFLLSPEFHDGWWHRWVHMSLSFCL